MEENIHGLKLQRNRYLREENEALTSLSGVTEALLPLNLTGPLPDQVAQLVKTMRDAHEELELSHFQNASLPQ